MMQKYPRVMTSMSTKKYFLHNVYNVFINSKYYLMNMPSTVWSLWCNLLTWIRVRQFEVQPGLLKLFLVKFAFSGRIKTQKYGVANCNSLGSLPKIPLEHLIPPSSFPDLAIYPSRVMLSRTNSTLSLENRHVTFIAKYFSGLALSARDRLFSRTET